MIQVDDDFMAEVGLTEMPEAEKQAFMEHAEEELEVRVGREIGAKLSDAQLTEFEQIADTPEAAGWLERNVPDFREVALRVFQAFKDELVSEKQEILA